MTRKDYLDILGDYLKANFSQDEVRDIVRDYEEYFLNGELENKSVPEIIKELGSPKSIAKQLIEEDQISKGIFKESSSTNKNNSIDVQEIVNKATVVGAKVLKSSQSFYNETISPVIRENSFLSFVQRVFTKGLQIALFCIRLGILLFGGFFLLMGSASILGGFGISTIAFKESIPLGWAIIFGSLLASGIAVIMWGIYFEINFLLRREYKKLVVWRNRLLGRSLEEATFAEETKVTVHTNESSSEEIVQENSEVLSNVVENKVSSTESVEEDEYTINLVKESDDTIDEKEDEEHA